MLGNVNLGELIEWLEKQDQDLIVKDGFGEPHCDRGYYENLSFDPLPEAKISEMLNYAKSAVNQTFEGYHGGEYKMTLFTPVGIGYDYESAESITSIHFKYWLLTGRKNKEV